jgi:hypothetical protein
MLTSEGGVADHVIVPVATEGLKVAVHVELTLTSTVEGMQLAVVVEAGSLKSTAISAHPQVPVSIGDANVIPIAAVEAVAEEGISYSSCASF